MTVVGRFIKWVSKTFLGLKSETKRLIPVAIEYVEAVKKYMDDPKSDRVFATIETFLPPKVDAAIDIGHALIHKWLPVFLLKLQSINDVININNLEARVNAALIELKMADPAVRKNFYTGFSTLVLSKISNDNVDDATLNKAIQDYYLANYPQINK